MAHLAFVSLPAAGHVNPTLPLVAELVRRGHRVTYSSGGVSADAIAAAGATALPGSGESVRPTGTMNDQMLASVDASRAVLPGLEKTFTDDPADLLCYDWFTPYAPLLAHRLGVPTVATVPTHASNASFNLFALMMPPDFDTSEYLAAQSQLVADLGVPMEPPTPRRQIVFLPRRFQLAGDTFDDSYVFVGPTLAEQREDWQPPASADKVLFVSLGTVFNDHPDFFRAVVAAFADTDWHVAMAVGDQVDLAAVGEIPSNFEVRPFFPQQAVLRHATAFLTHAGMNSVMEALLSQVPMIAHPLTPEQAANADQLVALGFGRVLTDLAELAVTVTEVAQDKDIRANLATMADDLRAAGGATAAADAVEAALPGSA
ncbi:macrolide family glycosyltransferase [Kutzneria sp. CA-103260]|uniref:macrolide family glycosyltransferase n=1 Tax=Kutzneria sp. CA-103260 TaxID=2802641 RepID=UPI001BAB7BD5|nr:macrolide family glycosyltransferase [Kutzneria sp. CA-103260]QUQ64748.1 UDP glycosyl transferase [Kutzneria sp. CA-103260]